MCVYVHGSYLHLILLFYELQASKVWQQRCQVIVEGLEEHVDPFDLDVFSPYMQANLMKATQRSAVSSSFSFVFGFFFLLLIFAAFIMYSTSCVPKLLLNSL